MFMGGWVIEVTLLSSNRTPELEYVGVLFMFMMLLIMLRGSRGGPEPTWVSTVFIWLARLCLEGADASNRCIKVRRSTRGSPGTS